MSLVPAVTTATGPRARGGDGRDLDARACAPRPRGGSAGIARESAAALSASTRVTSTLCPARAISSAMRGDLLDGLALAEDHLGHALAEGAVVIDGGEAEVAEGELPQRLERVVDRDVAPAHALEQLADEAGIHGGA